MVHVQDFYHRGLPVVVLLLPSHAMADFRFYHVQQLLILQPFYFRTENFKMLRRKSKKRL